MGDHAERFHGGRADALGRRIGDNRGGVVGFDLPQLAHEGVIFAVADDRAVQGVVEIPVAVDLSAELVSPAVGRCECIHNCG
jgi:hypothetical protein